MMRKRRLNAGFFRGDAAFILRHCASGILLCMFASVGAQSAPPLNVNKPDEQVASSNQNLSRFRLEKFDAELMALLEEHIAVFSRQAEAQIQTPGLLRKLQNDIEQILATEGYFSPQIKFDVLDRDGADSGNANEGGQNLIQVSVSPNQRSSIKEVQIHFTGALEDAANAGKDSAIQRRENLIKAWTLSLEKPFRQDDWSKAKTHLMESLKSELYMGATWVDSRAEVDAENHSVSLILNLDSGAEFYFGDLQVTGLERYPLWLIDRFDPPKKGQAYTSRKLLEFQSALQNSAYFSTVGFNVEPDSSKAQALPIEVSLNERQARDLGLSLGESSNTGLHAEVTYRDRNFANQVWDLQSALRIEQKRQLAYAQIYLPPSDHHQLDSFGVLWDQSKIEGVTQARYAFGVLRTTTRGHVEQRLGGNFMQESVTENRDVTTQVHRKSHATVLSTGWTWRDVDDLLAPRSGHRLQLDFSGAHHSLLSNQSFIRAYTKYQQWFPIAKRDSLQLRFEAGRVFSSKIDGIPEDYLFRIGGSNSVRGYAYQSIGIRAGAAVLGGPVMGTASAEYLHWSSESIGAAVFYDVGAVAPSLHSIQTQRGYGAGLRWKTPAGPVALDLAYGRQTKRFRLDFSIAFAF